MRLVLSGTGGVVPSGTAESCYREPKSPRKPRKSSPFCGPNYANNESYGFFLTHQRPVDEVPERRDHPARSLSEQALQDRGDNPDNLTAVSLTWIAGKREEWLRFGHPIRDRIVNRRTRIASFQPGAIFALVRWTANDFGTIASHIDVVRAVGRHEACTTLPCIDPGGELLLHIASWPKVSQVQRAIDSVEAIGIDACDADPDHWRQIHHRIAAGLTPSEYSSCRHRAWLRRKAVWQ